MQLKNKLKAIQKNVDGRSRKIATVNRLDEITGSHEEAQCRSHINISDDETPLNYTETR